MKDVRSLIIAVALALATPLTFAAEGSHKGTDTSFGIEASSSSSAFWYAGTSGVSPN